MSRLDETSELDRLRRKVAELENAEAERQRVERALIASQERLSASEERLSVALEGAEIGLWDQNFVTGEIVRSPRWASMLGYGKEEIGPSRGVWIDLIHPDDVPLVEEAARDHEGGRTARFCVEHRMRTMSGDWKWILNWGRVVERDCAGTPIRAAGIHLDITKLKSVEQALRESEERYRLLFENAEVLVAIFNRDGEVLMMNRRKAAWFGGEPADFIGKSFHDLFPDKADEYAARIRDVIDSEEAREYEDVVPFPDGVRYLLSNVQPVRDAAGAVRAAQIISQDMTTTKEAEEALRASEERYRSVFRNASEGIVIVDSERGLCLFANPAMCRMLGCAEEELRDIDPDTLLPGGFGRSLFGPGNVPGPARIDRQEEIPCVRKDGGICWCTVSLAPVTIDGRACVMGIYADVTERKQLRDLEARAQRLESAGRVAGQVAHDFNNLLSPLVAYPDLIREDIAAGKPVERYLDIIEGAARQMSEINQQLLSLGRRGHYAQVPLDLNDVVTHLLDGFEAPPSSLVIETDLCDDAMNVKGGAAQIARAVMNLIVNSRDATGDIGRITIRTENIYIDDLALNYGSVPRGEYVRLSVADTGSGIADDVLPSIFDPFFTTKAADRDRGSGLGLSVVDAVMNDHGGAVDLKTRAGEGTTVYLYFPVTRETLDAEAPAESGGAGESILVVDDDEVQRDVCLDLLGRLGYRARAAASGEEALELLLSGDRFDLFILDMIMPPGIDGAETYRRALAIVPDQRAIILSGFSESARVEKALALGAGAFVRKPLTREMLASTVRSELDRV